MFRRALIGLAAAAVVGTTLVPTDSLADGVGHHHRIHSARAHMHHWVARGCGRWCSAGWPRLAYLDAALGPATGAATRLPAGYYPECRRDARGKLSCQYPF